jgi:hypothetical protein
MEETTTASLRRTTGPAEPGDGGELDRTEDGLTEGRITEPVGAAISSLVDLGRPSPVAGFTSLASTVQR